MDTSHYGRSSQWDDTITCEQYQLGLELPESTGNLYLYISALKKEGRLWQMEEE